MTFGLIIPLINDLWVIIPGAFYAWGHYRGATRHKRVGGGY